MELSATDRVVDASTTGVQNTNLGLWPRPDSTCRHGQANHVFISKTRSRTVLAGVRFIPLKSSGIAEQCSKKSSDYISNTKLL